MAQLEAVRVRVLVTEVYSDGSEVEVLDERRSLADLTEATRALGTIGPSATAVKPGAENVQLYLLRCEDGGLVTLTTDEGSAFNVSLFLAMGSLAHGSQVYDAADAIPTTDITLDGNTVDTVNYEIRTYGAPE